VAAVLGLTGTLGLEKRDLRNLNLENLKKGPNGGVSPTPQKKAKQQTGMQHVLKFDIHKDVWPEDPT
jgi:hypothetical protein